MKIIEFLTEDHEKLRQDCLEIRKNLNPTTQETQKIFREKVKNYIAHFELHEAVEDLYLLKHLQTPSGPPALKQLLEDYEKGHKKIWESLNALIQQTHHRNSKTLQADFFNFVALIECHTSCEERLYFPIFKQHIDEKTLEHLGEKCKKYYERYSGSKQEDPKRGGL